MSVLSQLSLYLGYPFVRYALVAGVLIALCSSLLGTVLVMRRFSLIGDGLSRVAFGAYAVAAVAGVTQDMLLVLPVTVAAAVLLLYRGDASKVKGDAAIAMLSATALAAGYLLMSVFGSGTNVSADVCGTLFGSTSILTLTLGKVVACVVLAVVVVAVFVLLYNRIFAVTFDEAFAKATGVKSSRYNLLVAVLVAVVIVLGMNLVGALLLSALIVFPTLAAMRVFRTFRSVTLCSAALSVACALAGILVSILASTPVGSTVVLVDFAAFLAFCLVGKIAGR